MTSLSNKLILRPFVAADEAAVAMIYFQSRARHFSWVKKLRLADFAQATQGETVQVAELDGQIVGFASVSEWDGFLHLLFIKPGFESQGIGSALLTWARQLVQLPLTLKVVAQNKAAQRFYEREGFVLIARSPLASPPNLTYQDGQKRH